MPKIKLDKDGNEYVKVMNGESGNAWYLKKEDHDKLPMQKRNMPCGNMDVENIFISYGSGS